MAENPERFCRFGVNAIRRNSNSQMFETEKYQTNTTRRRQKLYVYVFGLFGFGSFEIVSDFVFRI